MLTHYKVLYLKYPRSFGIIFAKVCHQIFQPSAIEPEHVVGYARVKFQF